jgi:hypothetical protein
MIDQKLAMATEQVGQGNAAFRSLEGIALLDPFPGQRAALA